MRRRAVLVTFCALPLLLGAWVDWFHPARPWQRATGWDRIPPDERPAVASRLWPDDPSGPPAPRLHWLGHAGFLVRWRGRTLLVDPNASGHCTIVRRHLEPCLDPSTIGPVDVVLISHAHYDHLDLPTLEALGTIGTLAVPRGAGAYLPASLHQRARVVELEPGESLRVGAIEAIAVPAVHNGNRFHPLRSHELALGWVIRDELDAVYWAGDTGFGDHFAQIGELYHPRVAVLPIGAYSPRLILKPHHLSPEEAVEAARQLGVETVVPSHFGTFTLFLDRPGAALPRFARAAREHHLHWVMPALLVSSQKM